ncbi:MAG: carboxylating nicotinate-nucleotide diphosphorylase [Pseudomonadota bacterium]
MIQANLLRQTIRNNVYEALLEDLGFPASDVSAALIDADEQASARVITRTPGFFCGVGWVEETARQVDPTIEIEWQVADGDAVLPDQLLWLLRGGARSLLSAERTMLNFVQLLSGVATRTASYVERIGPHPAQLLDTRKTLPGLRLAQKYAVTCGGGANHRLGLYDAFLLKENHIAAAGSISAAVQAARALHPDKPVEVEVETIEQLLEAMDAGADIAMVDNFDLATTREAVTLAAGRIKLEASGGIDETTITDIAATGVDYISSGDLTKRIEPMDLSMRFVSNAIANP